MFLELKSSFVMVASAQWRCSVERRERCHYTYALYGKHTGPAAERRSNCNYMSIASRRERRAHHPAMERCFARSMLLAGAPRHGVTNCIFSVIFPFKNIGRVVLSMCVCWSPT